MSFEFDRLNRRISDDELLADLKAVAQKLGRKSVTRSEQDSIGKFHSVSIYRRFGCWEEAHQRAGLELSRPQKNSRVTDDLLFENLEEVWRSLGRQPRAHEMAPPLSKYEATTYKRRYGTWLQALEKFAATVSSLESSSATFEIVEASPDARKHNTRREVNWRLRFLVMRRDQFKCLACGRSPANMPGIMLHIDHIKAWANGGETVFENLQTLCEQCNIGKSDTH